MAPIALPRRSLLATAVGAWLVIGSGDTGRVGGYTTLRALCAELDCPRSLGAACRRVLPEQEAGSRFLAASLFRDLPPAARRSTSASTLAALIRERSRADFRDGRIITVDGWMLSLTDARLFALATLIAGERGKLA